LVGRADGRARPAAAHSKQEDTTTKEAAVPSIDEGRREPWTAVAAEPAVRAAEEAIVAEADAVLADTLAISTRIEARRRLARVLELKDRAARDPGSRDAYHHAADDLRNWAAGVYLASLREPGARRARKPAVKHENPHTEESASRRRSVPGPPFPGQPRRRPFYTSTPPPEQPDLAEREDTSRALALA
jgi:hypothetical protein